MTDDKKIDELAAHKWFAVDLFNKTWELMDKKDRTDDDDN